MSKNKKIEMFGIIFIIALSFIWINALYSVSQSISEAEEQKMMLGNDLYILKNEIKVVNGNISKNNNELNLVSTNLKENISELELLKTGKKYEMHDPTYSEVRNFLLLDNTNEIKDENFVCRHYAQTVNNNAEDQGIRCAYVSINLSGLVGHACVAFNTTDQGIVYFEPQHDFPVNLCIGKNYWSDCVVCPSGYYFKRSSDNIVKGFELFW